MASLLAKFRIDYSDLTVIPDVTKKPQDGTTSFFDHLIRNVKEKENEEGEDENAADEGDRKSYASNRSSLLKLVFIFFFLKEA